MGIYKKAMIHEETLDCVEAKGYEETKTFRETRRHVVQGDISQLMGLSMAQVGGPKMSLVVHPKVNF